MPPLASPDAPPAQPALHAAAAALADVASEAYWRSLCPSLRCGDAAYQASAAAAPFSLPAKATDAAAARLRDEGFTHVPSAKLPWAAPLPALADAVVSLMQHGWPPTFLLAFDEAWAMQRQAAGLLADVAGGNVPNGDALVWFVDPSKGTGAGFSPHRDRQPLDVPGSFRADGTPRYATAWVPFTDASPDNSCLYFIPRAGDPGYAAGDVADVDALAACLPSPEAYQRIRCVPAAAGSAVLFSHRTFHWGSAGRAGTPTPRINMSFGAADPSFEPHYLEAPPSVAAPFPPLAARLALAAAQVVCYHDRFVPMEAGALRRYKSLIDGAPGALSPAYARKTAAEYVAAATAAAAAKAAAARAAKAATKAAAAALQPKTKRKAAAAAADVAYDDDDVSDAEAGALLDEALDAMLDAEAAGHGSDFDDDFDDGPEGAQAAPPAGGTAHSDDADEEAAEDASDDGDDDDSEDDEPLSDEFWAAAAARFKAGRAAGGAHGSAAAAASGGYAAWERELGDEEGALIRRKGAAATAAAGKQAAASGKAARGGAAAREEGVAKKRRKDA